MYYIHRLYVIKTAIITIIISFISGVLLDNYKNLAPKISCTMGKCVPIKMNNKKIRAYILKVKNMSNKTLHDLTVNVQGHHNDLKMDDAQITGGLKFDICGEYNNFNVSIPFLSKNDEFSVKVFVDDVQGEHSKPVITLRSPENFKKIGNGENNGVFTVLSGTIQKNKIEKSILNKKTLITTASIISLLCIVFLGKGLYKSISGIAQDESIQSDTEQKSNSIDTSSNEKTKNSSSNTSNNGKNQSSSTKSSSKDGISNEVKGQDSSSYDNGKASDNKTNVNSEENKSTSASNTDANKETVNEKNQDSSSSTANNNNTNKQSADEKANQSTKTSTPTNTAGNTKANQSSTSSSSDTNVNSASEKQQVSNSESSEN